MALGSQALFGTPATTPTHYPAPAAPVASGTPTPAPLSPTPTRAAPTTTPTPAPVDRRAGAQLNQPWVVRGIPVVSREHRITAAYVPPWASRPDGLHPDAYAAAQRMIAAAKAKGNTLKIRSGYRDFAVQKASFENAVAEQGRAAASRYYAEAGASEHQIGLAFDVWDGRNRGEAFTRSDEADWVAAHAHEYGFIIRYPEGKEAITGIAHESWHLRWVGVDVARHFTPGSRLSLEEFLGIRG